MTTKIHSLSYSHSTNLGDEIQTIAATRLIQNTGLEQGGFLDRNTLHTTAHCNVLCNGYFEHSKLQALFQDNINPIISNLHIFWDATRPTLQPEIVTQLKAHAPIGCRDRHTMSILKAHGIDCFFNYCLTLTLPRRETTVQDGKIFIVDLVDLDGFLPLPESMRKSHEIEFLTHACGNIYSHDAKMLLAQELLDRYKNEAELVITSRLHCALPCIAMGIPVLLFADPNSERMKLATEIIPIHPYNFINNIYTRSIHHPYPTLSRLKQFVWQNFIISPLWRIKYASYYRHEIDWVPQAPDLEPLKEKIINDTTAMIKRKLSTS